MLIELFHWIKDMKEIKKQIEMDDKQYNILLKNYCKLEKEKKYLEIDLELKDKAFNRLKEKNKKLRDEIKELKKTQ